MGKKGAQRKRMRAAKKLHKLNKAFGGVSITQTGGAAGAPTKVYARKQQKKTAKTMKLTAPKKKKEQRQIRKKICEEDIEFREEQAALMSRRRGGKLIVEESSTADTKKHTFQPAEATFNPSVETMLSHGMTASIQGIGQQKQWRDGDAGNGLTKTSENPLLAIAQKYRSGEGGINYIDTQESNNPFAALNENDDDNQPTHNRKSTFSFAPASFTFQSTAGPTPAFGGAIIDPDL
uniref:Uncharacterized protein n=1 Tax=Leptocylindrus danicus TaxID=163516 RepID=A0A7S2PRH2_9STRA|mmetsp:Transcript_8221/g.12231  ORF Transcript_8221/g.12231 Transcript_8221/m.12231 type:complete len:235 (+) Transcript_8221:63-767(+)